MALIEFLPWYIAGYASLFRCSGCFALVIEADFQGHYEWHERLGS